jgi:predicted nucleotidyltransferase
MKVFEVNLIHAKLKVMSQIMNCFLEKDFIQTQEGLFFAVVNRGVENDNLQDKVLCFLRYAQDVRANDKQFIKLSTLDANAFLAEHHPDYLYHSSKLDADVHGVRVDRIVQHHQPKQRLQTLINMGDLDKVENDCVELCRLFAAKGLSLSSVGITGSMLIGAQRDTSDIDLVIYDRELFHLARKITKELIKESKCHTLTRQDWDMAYHKRQCSLTYEEYVWHEQRKNNKGMINGRKFDISLVDPDADTQSKRYQKQGQMQLIAKVIDTALSYDFPAVYRVEHPEIDSIVCFTATYSGQALTGETIEVAGIRERSSDGSHRIIVGSNREAPGEYIKVIKHAKIN